LHNEDFVVEGEALVVTVEVVIELLAECLWVVEELKSGKIDRYCVRLLLLFLLRVC